MRGMHGSSAELVAVARLPPVTINVHFTVINRYRHLPHDQHYAAAQPMLQIYNDHSEKFVSVSAVGSNFLFFIKQTLLSLNIHSDVPLQHASSKCKRSHTAADDSEAEIVAVVPAPAIVSEFYCR